jgi:ABC-type glycerol-3-phosphate transport system substrate-binding protein
MDGTVLGPGQFVVLANNLAAFATKYPGVHVDGVYAGSLANGGERLTLAHASGTTITSIAYNNKYPWPTAADEIGFSLVPVNPNSNPDFQIRHGAQREIGPTAPIQSPIPAPW